MGERERRERRERREKREQTEPKTSQFQQDEGSLDDDDE